MRRGALLPTLFIAAFGAACSGGGGSSTLPPPVGGFSNSSLKGQYAFVMSGQAPDGFIARIGTFVADGNGGISGGTELVDTFSNNFQQFAFSSSNYQVQADGRGAINLTNLTGTFSFSITMTSTSGGIICQTDGVTGTSGTFELQDTSAFTPNALSGSFVFDNAGLDPTPFPNTNPDSIVGQIVLNAGTVSSGVYDENDGAVASGPVAITGGNYSIADATNGLGSLVFNNNFHYAFVIVNSRKFHMIEVPPTGTNIPITAGTANAQTAPPATTAAFNGNFAFLIAGVGTHSQNEKAGRFTADQNGGLGSIAMDDKQLGNPTTNIPSGSLSAATYTIDTNFPGSGRGTVTFTDSNKGKFQFVFYMSSATQGVIQDNSKGLVGDGVIMAQTGAPFSQSTFANDYAFNWSGVSTNATTLVSAEEDFVGHVKITSAASNNVTGAMDFSELNSNQGAFHDSALTGGLTINGDGTNSSGPRSGITIKAAGTNGGPSTTFPFTVYAVNPQTIFVISQDSDRVTGGTFTVQVTPP
jgi:hypothetical protein